MDSMLPLLLLLFAAFCGSDAAWCVCRNETSTTAQQQALDYACSNGVDCTPISPNGACYQPNTVNAHCSFAVNSYYQRQAQATTACVFSGTATTVTTDPSTSGCTYPGDSSSAGTSNTTAPPPPPGTLTGFTPPPPPPPPLGLNSPVPDGGDRLLRVPTDTVSIAVSLSGLLLFARWR